MQAYSYTRGRSLESRYPIMPFAVGGLLCKFSRVCCFSNGAGEVVVVIVVATACFGRDTTSKELKT